MLKGTYSPMPVRRKEIPKPGVGVRMLGIPTVLDRVIQQAIAQVLTLIWDYTFSEYSYAFRLSLSLLITGAMLRIRVSGVSKKKHRS